MDSKITKILMDSGADSMIPNIANKESAFHYCGQSGNAAVKIIFLNPFDFQFSIWPAHVAWEVFFFLQIELCPYSLYQVVKEIIKFLHAGQIQLVVNKQSG